MNTQNQSKMIYRSFADRMIPLVSPQTRQLIELGYREGWKCELLGQAPMPNKPVRVEHWIVVPAHQDPSSVPTRTLQRVQTIFDAGLRPQGFVLVHDDAQKLLQAPRPGKRQVLPRPLLPDHIKSELQAAGVALMKGASLVAVTSMMGILAITVGSLGAILAASVALIAGIDPILVAVMEDGCWIEIDRWWD